MAEAKEMLFEHAAGGGVHFFGLLLRMNLQKL
jgi:hypothetical protein